jgi:hypothetical protein
VCGDPNERNAFLTDMQGRACRFVRDCLREKQIGRVAWQLNMARELSRQQVAALMNELAEAYLLDRNELHIEDP